jgi:hypothetical protein
MENKELAPDEVKEIRELRRLFADITQEFGVLFMSKMVLEEEENDLKDRLEELKKREGKYLTIIREKYGVGKINVTDGIFISETSE